MFTEDQLRQRYGLLLPHLDERHRRLIVAADAVELERGGIARVARASGVSRPAIYRGIAELATLPLEDRRQRRQGAGRKRVEVEDPAVLAALATLLDPVTRGDPESLLRWSSKSCEKLAATLTQQGHAISGGTVRRLLLVLDYRLHATVKTLEGGNHPDRDAQFQWINTQARTFLDAGSPAISVDGKKKELIGDFANGGREWRPTELPEEVEAYDYAELAEGKGIPYGVYDVGANQGWVSVGNDHDTAAFAVATIQRWWEHMRQELYPAATRLLICADGGGSNGMRCKLWKWALQELATATGLSLTVCHYPPGTSKWNKIEHRLFSFISMNWRGKPLVSYEVMVQLIRNTTTKTGLRVEADRDTSSYPTGIQVSEADMAAIQIRHEEFHGEWNYTILPQS